MCFNCSMDPLHDIEDGIVNGVEVKDHQASLWVSENAAINPLPSTEVVECESSNSHEMW